MADEAENLAQLVALGSSIRDGCQALGITENVGYKISGKRDFKQRVSEIRTEKTEGLAAQALGAAEDAIRELRTLATTAEKDADRVSACRVILSQVLPLAENTELRRRLNDIERGVAEAAGKA